MDTKHILQNALSSSFPEILHTEFEDRGGEREVSVRLLQGLGTASRYLTPAKIRDIWVEYSKHDVLFSDYTQGKVEPFILALVNPRSYWMELFELNLGKPIGIASVSEIIPEYDAKGHFAFWDKIGSGREEMIWGLMQIFFDEFDLKRISAEVPVYQKGVIRFIKRLGFQREGEKRRGVFYKGQWMNTHLFGLLREELEEIRNVGNPIR